MLKAIKHLSMNATMLEVLQNANAIEILTRILDEQSSGLHSTVRYIHIALSRFGTPVYNNTYIRFLGNVESYIPDVLQPLSFEQGSTGGGCASRHNTFTRARYRVQFSSQTVCASYSLRPCQCWEELSDVAVAARWAVDVYQATHRSLLPSQRSRVYSFMVIVSTNVEASVD
jgi:hypothetical protein